MTPLILKHARKDRLGAIDRARTTSMDDESSLYRSGISIGAGATRAPAVLDNHCSRVSADGTRSRVFSTT
jgi:hypothetical protein